MRVFRANAIDLEPGMLIVWGGHGANKTSEVSAALIDRIISESGSVRVAYELRSRYSTCTTEYHTIQKNQLRKALVILP